MGSHDPGFRVLNDLPSNSDWYVNPYYGRKFLKDNRDAGRHIGPLSDYSFDTLLTSLCPPDLIPEGRFHGLFPEP